jgi:flagellar motility protein MotE (MotC chaperone)
MPYKTRNKEKEADSKMGSLKLLPILIFVACLSFIVRFGEVVVEVKTADQALSGAVMAAAPAKDEEKAEPVDVPEGLAENEPLPSMDNEWADPTTLDMNFTETQRKALDELKERREVLDSLENRLSQREALLEVTEKRIEEKITELEAIRNELKDLLGEQSEQEEARMTSLVKIYEGMKPKDAAIIFDNLDMDILLGVISRMSERRSAPILASMSPERVQRLTTLLAEQKKLPEIPE